MKKATIPKTATPPATERPIIEPVPIPVDGGEVLSLEVEEAVGAELEEDAETTIVCV
jgi:hypothetical protein